MEWCDWLQPPAPLCLIWPLADIRGQSRGQLRGQSRGQLRGQLRELGHDPGHCYWDVGRGLDTCVFVNEKRHSRQTCIQVGGLCPERSQV